MRRKARREKANERARQEAEHRKLYSFRLKEDLMGALKEDAGKEGFTLTGLLEAIIKDYLRLP